MTILRCSIRRAQLDRGLAPRTINKHISAIRSALSYAVRAEIIPANKLLGPHRLMLREECKPLRILEVGEVTALLNVASDLRYKTAISLAYYLGMRRGEISRMRWQDVDVQEFRLDIFDKPEAHTKTRKSRSVALRKETAVLLDRMHQQRSNEFVFMNPQAFYWSCDKWLSSLVEQVGIDDCTLDDLRKTCKTPL